MGAAERPRRLAITLGDPRGVGPEVALGAARRLALGPGAPELLFIGPDLHLRDAGVEYRSTGEWAAGGSAAAAGACAAAAIERATRMALDREVDGIVTAPIDKNALHAAGVNFPGHTEMLASLAGVADVVMMMAAEKTELGGPLRVVLATTHLALSEVPRAFTEELLVTQTRITAEALTSQWALPRPRIALCAFNPHASDGGLFGNEEECIYGPALARLAERGIDVTGPVPADTVFVRAVRGEFDAVIAPYHDVGMAAFKTASFGRGVNVTLGLPFVRTSPDHGTALDIAGRGVADPSSMHEAILLADRLAAARTAA